MAFRSRMTLVVLGIATTLLIAVILAIPALLNLDRYLPSHLSFAWFRQCSRRSALPKLCAHARSQ